MYGTEGFKSDMQAVAEETSKQMLTGQAVIRLNFQDGTREVIVQTEDEDRFWMTCEDAARACKAHMGVVEWKKEFTRLLGYLRIWAEAEKSLVKMCFVSVREGHLIVVMVPAIAGFDFNLADKVATLDWKLAKEFPACPSEVLQVPQRDSFDGFFNTGQSLLVYGG